MSDLSTKLLTRRKKKKMTNEQTMRYNELMRIAKGNEFMSMSEFDELCMLMKIRGYHQDTPPGRHARQRGGTACG